MDSQKALLRILVDDFYDVQATRIAMGNRIVASLRSMGLVEDPAEKSKPKKAGTDLDSDDEGGKRDDPETNKIIVRVLNEFTRISDVYAEQFSGRGKIVKALEATKAENVFIKTELTYSMVSLFVQMSQNEKSMLSICDKEVKNHPLWEAFFKDVKGCGPLMAAVCIAYLDPTKARWPSSFWKYAGLDVVVDENGSHGRSRHDACMVKYIDKDGEEKEKRSLGYNPTVKTKLVGVLGTSFLRAGRDGKYAQLYYEYKNRQENLPEEVRPRPVVIHRRSIRYAVKMFLADLWLAWRTIEGLPTGKPYAVAMLGRHPHHDPRNASVGATDEDVMNAALRAGAVSPMSLGE